MATQDFNLSYSEAHDKFIYRDGKLYRKYTTSSNALAGSEISFLLNTNGYQIIQINKKKIRVHRIIFLMFYGYVPEIIDHINGNRIDNRIENLREATPAQNMHNKPASKFNLSKQKNVSWVEKKKLWCVTIKANGKQHYGGCFKDLQKAVDKATRLRNEIHGEFANHG
jgi:hypothetical protein